MSIICWGDDSMFFFLFVEGKDDERFMQKYFQGENIKIIKYSTMKTCKLIDYLNSIKRMPDCDFHVFVDEDGKGVEKVKKEYKDRLKIEEICRITVVKYEIESWYLAGMSSENMSKYGMKDILKTDVINKEGFWRLFKEKERNINTLINILKDYDCNLAKKRNSSFSDFHSNFESLDF
jgi:5S rRNA maturation endonuclease (ribonuclease M5)